MRKILAAIFIISLTLFLIIPYSIADDIPYGNGSGGNTVIGLHDSLIDVNLSISDLGSGAYGMDKLDTATIMPNSSIEVRRNIL